MAMAEREGGRAERQMVPLTRFEGITVDAARYRLVADRYDSLALGLVALMRDTREAGFLRADAPMPEPVLLAMRELNVLIATANGMCTQSPPPKPFGTVQDADGKLIYQCGHKKLHRWDLDGNPLPPGAP